MEAQASARIHRFRESVGMHFAGHGTLYLTPEMARAIAARLADCSFDIEHYKFEDSMFADYEFGPDGESDA